jgi:hypothetical protein
VKAFSACFFLLATALVLAQTPDTAAISGRVVDQTEAAVSGVHITAKNQASGLTRSTETDDDGSFSIRGLPVSGTYNLTAAKQGFTTAVLKDIALVGGTRAAIRLRLNAAGGKTEITVTGTAGQVRADEPQLGNHLDARQMEDLPLLSRKITYLPLLNAANRPAINQGDAFLNQNLFTTNGAGRRQTWFEIDGGNGVDLWGRQTIFTNIPLAAVAEMTILQNAFSAEYGGSTGSVVNIVTKSGSNNFHGELLALTRPSGTAAALSGFSPTNAASGNDLTSDRLGQGALSISGPLGRGMRTQFFASGEYTAEDRASPVTSPIAPGTYVGRYRNWLGFTRIDHEISGRNNLFLRADLDGFRDTNPSGTVGGNNLPSVARVFKRHTYSAELGETAVLNANLLNNLRLQFQLGSPITQFAPVIYSTQYVVPVSTGGTFTSGTSQSALLLNRQYEVSDTASAILGRHQIRFGAGAIIAHSGGNSKEFGGPVYLGQLRYATCTQAAAFCESPAYLQDIRNVQSYTQSYGNANYAVTDALWSLFIQDDVRVRSDFTLNLGLRYERQTFTDARKNFAPRVGFAYDWFGAGKTVIRGGFGIYYSQIVDNSEANYALTGPQGVFNYTAAPGQIGFPASVSAVPLPAFPAGAVQPLRSLYVRPGDSAYLDQFFPTSALRDYPDRLLNPYSEQWSFGIEQQLRPGWVLSIDYIGSRTLKVNRPLDVDPPSPFTRTAPGQVRSAQAANCTRPYWIWWYAQQGRACNPARATNPQPPYSVIQTDVNDGYASYNALNINLSHRFSSRGSMLASYVWSHAINNVDPDIPGQNPNDPNFTGRVENGSAIFDQRQRLVLSGVFVAPLKINIGGIATLGSALPLNFITGVANSGDTGATADRPVINGVVVGRNTGRGRPIYDVSPFIERPFRLGSERRLLSLRAEAFNLFNRANFVGYSGTYGNGAAPGPGFGQPLAGVTNQLPARSLQFMAKFTF